MKKRLCLFALILALLAPALSSTACADTGPKPSVVVRFQGLEQETYYVTLLSDISSTGPWRKSGTYETYYGDLAVWEQFNAYTDADGFYFLGCFSDCSDTDTFQWTYYPPGTFKILIYFPAYDRFVASTDTYERYAFDSYYTADLSHVDITSAAAGQDMRVARTYDFTWELLSLLCRILVTIAIELGVAWLFGFRAKNQLLVIGLTNIVTQTVLNILLNVIHYRQGWLAFLFHYVWMEFVVFIMEGFVYWKLLRRSEEARERKTHPWLYAFVANLLSYAGGMVIAKWMPGIF